MKNDYDLNEKIKIVFRGLDYFIMPRYKEHYANDDYESFSLDILINNLDGEGLFIDVGAHYGSYSLCAAEYSESKVIAFEPVRENRTILSDNVKINHLEKQIEIQDAAASNEDGLAQFNIPWASDSAGFYDHPLAETYKKVEVKTYRLDTIVNNQAVSLVKIDAEGHEPKVLEGMESIFENNKKLKLIVEFNPQCLRAAGRQPLDLLKLLDDRDKAIYLINESSRQLINLTNRIDKWADFLPENGYANLLCLPKPDHQYLMFVSHSSDVGGAESAMVEQIANLQNYNMVSHVVIPSKGELELVLKKHGIGYSIIGNFGYFKKAPDTESARHINCNNALAAVKIYEESKKIQPSIIINNSIVNPWGSLAADKLKLPLIWMIHEYGDLDHGIVFPISIDAYRDYILNTADRIVCCSKAILNSFKPGNIGGKKVQTVYNLLDLEAVSKLASEKLPVSRKGDYLKLCVVGNLAKGKGQLLAVEAVSLLKKRGVKTELILIGNTNKQFKKDLQDQINDLGVINSVKMLGYKNNPFPYVEEADIVLMCSPHEAFGRTTAEAMYLKKVVIGSDSGGTQEMIINGRTGFTFEPNNAQSLAEVILEVSKLPASKLSQIGSSAHDHIVKVLDKNKNTEQLAKIIRGAKYDGNKQKGLTIVFADGVGVLDEQNLELKQNLEHVNALLSHSQQTANELSHQLQTIKNSRSWKSTQVLRRINKKIRL